MANQFIFIVGLVIFSAISADATFTREERSLIDGFIPDIISKGIGKTVGVMGQFWGKQENKKCYYYWGYPYSGPNSVNPERWNDEKFDQDEEGGIANAASDAVAFMGNAFQAVTDETMKEQMCLGYGMGYKTPQPGYPNKPGTCPGSRYCQPGQGRPGYQTVVTTTSGSSPQYFVNPGNPGTYTVTINHPGSPPTYEVRQGNPPTTITTTTGGNPQYVTYQPQQPPVTEVRYLNQPQQPQQPVTTYQTNYQLPPGQCPCPCQG